MKSKPVCLWVSRHRPNADQRSQLSAYTIVQVDTRFTGIPAMLKAVAHQQRIHKPSLILAVMPFSWLGALAAAVDPVPVIRARYLTVPGTKIRHWTGVFTQVIGVRLRETEWDG